MLKGVKQVDQPKTYRIPKPVKLDKSDIWDRPEYRAYDYVDMIMSIIEIEKSIPYQRVKEILTTHSIPCDTGQLWYGLNRLKDKIKISATYIISVQKS